MRIPAYDDERGRVPVSKYLLRVQRERDRLVVLVGLARPRQVPVELARLHVEDRAQVEERAH